MPDHVAGHSGGQTEGQIRGQTGGQTEGQTEGQTGGHIPDWTCSCGFFNTPPPANSADCNRCAFSIEKEGTACRYHCGKDMSTSNTSCYSCWNDYRYVYPSDEIINIMIREAKRGLKYIRGSGNSDCIHPRELSKDLERLEKQIAENSISKVDMMDVADEILWHVSFHHGLEWISIGEVLEHLDDIIRYNNRLERRQIQIDQERLEHIEEMKSHPDTFEVQSSDKKTIYLVNLELRFCTCPGFAARETCKHLKMKKKHK